MVACLSCTQIEGKWCQLFWRYKDCREQELYHTFGSHLMGLLSEYGFAYKALSIK